MLIELTRPAVAFDGRILPAGTVGSVVHLPSGRSVLRCPAASAVVTREDWRPVVVARPMAVGDVVSPASLDVARVPWLGLAVLCVVALAWAW